MAAHRDVRHRLEQYAANPTCRANTLSAALDIPMEEVAEAHGMTPKMGQSPFAIARGQMFEKSLFDNGAARLRRALINKKILPENATGLVDLRIKKNSGPMANMDASRNAFRELLDSMATGVLVAGVAPSIVAGPSLSLPRKGALSEGFFAIDVLTIHPTPGRIVLRVGEVKAYPDRGGFTDRTELATTRAQAGLYVYALRTELRTWQLDAKFEVANDGFLVLTGPGSTIPSVRPHEDLSHQAERAREIHESLGAICVPDDDNSSEKLPTPKRFELIESATTSYKSSCMSFCELADVCYDRALANGEGVILGESLGRLLGGIKIDRAIELMHGANPQNEDELELIGRLS